MNLPRGIITGAGRLRAEEEGLPGETRRQVGPVVGAPDEAKRVLAAMNAAGRAPRLYSSPDGDGSGNEKQPLQIYAAVVAFWEKNLGPSMQ